MGILRVFLALNVIFCHVGPLWGIRLADFKTAVEMFFIISGFYMSLILDRKYTGKNSYFLFISNRFLRIFPLYWAVLAASVLAYSLSGLFTGEWLALAPFIQWHAVLKPAALAFACFSNAAIFGQAATLFLGFDIQTGALFFTKNFTTAQHPFWHFLIVPQAWSLSLELVFYVLAPFLLRRDLKTVLGLMLASFSLRVWLVYGLHWSAEPWAYRFFPSELVFFLAGNISYRIYAAFRDRGIFAKYAFAATLAFFFIFAALPYPSMPEEMRGTAYFFLTVLGLPFVFDYTKKNKIDSKIGEFSYPIYLVHIQISVLMPRFFGFRGTPAEVVVASALLSWILLKIIAEPLEKIRQARWRLAVPAAAILFLMLGFVFLPDAACAADIKVNPQPSATILGVFNPESPEQAGGLGAKAVRIFVSAQTLKQGAHSKMIETLAEYKRAGFTVIATVGVGGKKKPKLPEIDSAQWKKKGENFELFLRAAGPSIDYISIANEPLVDMAASDFAPREDGRIPGIEFFKQRAVLAQSVIHSDAKFSHIKVSSPALFNLELIGKGHADARLNSLIFDWEISDSNIEVIDTHTHVKSASQIEEVLTFIRQKTNKPVIITEWSQAPAAREWLGSSIDPDFAQKWSVNARQANKAFIEACYQKPVLKAEWDEFVAKAPYDPSFIKEAFAVMVRHGVAVATYGADRQYGSVKFDAKQLLANRTVVPGPDGKPQENYLFALWYRNLAKEDEAGKN